MFEIYYSDNDNYNLSIPSQGVEPGSDLAGRINRFKKCRGARKVCNIIELNNEGGREKCFIEMRNEYSATGPAYFCQVFVSVWRPSITKRDD